MADDRTVKVTLRAVVGQYTKAMDDAARATKRVGDQSSKTSQETTSAFGRILQSAEQNRETWLAVGRGLTTAGIAMGALGAAALKTGIGYNTLQQTSRAALTTLLGGAEQANAQMDQLDEFARTSPFAKDVFISAQQQMLGFGIEAQKVIPYLDSIQNAVAATGGSNQDIRELTRIFSQISASAKITAEDLNQFGERGVDAATLIGSQMGKTGAEIREEISAGTLDARAALDALAAGMSERFDGAAESVKTTFAGAVDRVRAAWRDFSAELATPLVDPNGGGALVDLLNWAADMLRAFGDLPTPLKNTATAVFGVTTAVTLLGGALALAVPRIVSANTRLTEFATRGRAAALTAQTIRAAAVALPVVLGAAAAAFGIWATETAKARAETSAYADTLDDLGNATDDTARKINDALTQSFSGIQGFFSEFDSYADIADTIGVSTEDIRGAIIGIGEAQDRVTASFEAYKAAAETGAEERARISHISELNGWIEQQSGRLSTAQKETARAAEENRGLDRSTDTLTSSTEESTSAIKEQIDALQQQQDELRESADNAADADRAQIRFKESVDRAKQAVKDNGRTLDLNTKKGRDNRNALLDMRDAALADVDAQRKLGGSTSDLRSRMESQRRKFIDVARQMGLTKREANDLADEYGLIPNRVATDVVAQGVGRYKAQMDEARNAANNIPSSRTTTLTQYIRQVGSLVSGALGKGRASGGTIGFAEGGQVPGTPPAAPGVDNLLARTQHGTVYGIRSGEYVQSEPAVKHYGTAFMDALNQRRIPKGVLQGFAAGGPVPVRSAPATSGGAAVRVSTSVSDVTARMSPADIDAIVAGVREGAAAGLSGHERTQDSRARYARGGA